MPGPAFSMAHPTPRTRRPRSVRPLSDGSRTDERAALSRMGRPHEPHERPLTRPMTGNRAENSRPTASGLSKRFTILSPIRHASATHGRRRRLPYAAGARLMFPRSRYAWHKSAKVAGISPARARGGTSTLRPTCPALTNMRERDSAEPSMKVGKWRRMPRGEQPPWT